MTQAPLFIHLPLSLKSHKPCADGCKWSQTISSNCAIANLNSLQFNNQEALELRWEASQGKKRGWLSETQTHNDQRPPGEISPHTNVTIQIEASSSSRRHWMITKSLLYVSIHVISCSDAHPRSFQEVGDVVWRTSSFSL